MTWIFCTSYEEMVQILHYDVCPIKIQPIIILAHKRAKFLENSFVKFGYNEILRLIEFIEFQVRCFLLMRPFTMKRLT